MTICISRNLPGLGSNPDYSRLVYPDPPSHDFCVCLITAELMRRHHGAPGPLKVRLLLHEGQLGLYDYGPISLTGRPPPRHYTTKAYSDLMIENVLRPAMEMMGAVHGLNLNAPVSLDEIVNYVEYDHHVGQLVDAGRQGHEIPRWKPPAWAFAAVDEFLAGEKPVVITLREAALQPERNSQLSEWTRFAYSIKDRYPVLFVRDTAKAEVPLVGFRVWLRAATNTYVRAALYQRALVNLMVCTGPCVWCIFSDAPYLIFKQMVPALPDWDHGNPKGWREQDHMEVGDQYPWASSRQQLVWADDTFENIVTAFENVLNQLKT